MTLLLDQHLSRRLVSRLADLFPGSVHLSAFGMEEADDDEIWAFSIEKGYVIVTKDVDFRDKSLLRGWPPKIVWLRVGNCSTCHVEALLRAHHPSLLIWYDDPDSGIYELY